MPRFTNQRRERSSWMLPKLPREGACLIVLSILLVSLNCELTLALNPERLITQYVHQVWTSQDGLPQNKILAITQTRDGYLWLATEEGLARFDGVRFTVFDKANTNQIKDNVIQVLYESKEGSLWFGTGGGLNRLKDGEFTSYTTKDGLSNDTDSLIYEDHEGSLSIGTEARGNRFNAGRIAYDET